MRSGRMFVGDPKRGRFFCGKVREVRGVSDVTHDARRDALLWPTHDPYRRRRWVERLHSAFPRRNQAGSIA